MFLHKIAHYIPEEVVPNSYFTKFTGKSEDWMNSRTGIRERRKAGEGENTHSMGRQAVDALIPTLDFDPNEIDLIIGGTYTPYDTVVTLGHSIQHQLNIPDIPVLTASSACSTLINAVEIAEGYFAMKKASKAIIVAAEHNTAYSRDDDTVAGHLWGDGAVAFIVSNERISNDDFELLEITTGGGGTVGKAMEGVVLRPSENGFEMPYGRDVFINACHYMTKVSLDVLAKRSLTIKNVDFFIPHQANLRITKNVADQLGLPQEKALSNIQYLGNTGCAGCGIALSENMEKFKKDDLIVMTVFGGGYSYGSMLLKKG